jgi:hypothetical protein
VPPLCSGFSRRDAPRRGRHYALTRPLELIQHVFVRRREKRDLVEGPAGGRYEEKPGQPGESPGHEGRGGTSLEQDDSSSNRHLALVLCFVARSDAKPVSTFGTRSSAWLFTARGNCSLYQVSKRLTHVHLVDQGELPRTRPMLQVFLALQKIPDIVVRFVIDKAFQPISFGESIYDGFAMFRNTA